MLTGWDVSVFKLMMHRAVPQLFQLMQDRGERIVVDIDDFHFRLHEENIANQQTNPHKNPVTNRMHYEAAIRQADTVTVSTQFLANFYGARCRDVRLVRNALDVDRFHMVEQPEKPTIGWVGGTLWRSGDVELLREWLPDVAVTHQLRVHHSGHIPGDGRHFAVRAGLRRVTTIPMSLVKDYPNILKPIHVGLVPLARNDFNEAKSYLKGLEYAAAGIPFVATPTEEYRILAEAGVGRLAETPDEWRDHVIELLDPDVRRDEAARQRAIVEKDFHINAMGDKWHSAIGG
jgi:glycosyltransferase involved in cell wall biosynthesis